MGEKVPGTGDRDVWVMTCVVDVPLVARNCSAAESGMLGRESLVSQQQLQPLLNWS